ncbi:family 10 glycosylhydrolase [candidate division KSB1 bacterium]|nr:family 10 glycosylhydrolase [candidate division KSB1 bacterium]
MIDTYKIKIYIVFVLYLPAFLRSQPPQQTRALWVTRWDYSTPEDLKQIVHNAAALRFNVLLLQVRGNGTVFYNSEYEPWAEEFQMQNPGWDPLQFAIEQGHANGMQVHAWINVFPAWRGSKPPNTEHQLFLDHQDWLVVDVFGRRQNLNSHYVWLAPTNPHVKDYLLNICAELYQNYKIDGLHLDYIRYPGTAYSYDTVSIEFFKTEYGTYPEKKPQEWIAWRRAAITDFLITLSQNIKGYNPKLVLSASVLGDYDHGLRIYLQDSHEWLARGIVDAIFPMTYSANALLFESHLVEHKNNDHGRHVYPGIYARNIDQLRTQMEIVRRHHFKGLSVFAYGLLFKNHQLEPQFQDSDNFLWSEHADPSQFAWKNISHDIQGPAIIQVKTVPANLFNNTEFKIAAQIFDASGVYDDDTSAEGQGVYLKFGRNWPPTDGDTVKMSRIKNSDNWFITDQPITQQKDGLDFMCRIFAWDNYHTTESTPARNVGYSDIWSLSVLLPNISYVSAGVFGPELDKPTGIATDQLGQVWVTSFSDKAVQVLGKKGEPVPFNPILTGIDSDISPVPITRPACITFQPPNTMYIASNQHPTRIFRFNTETGKALPALVVDFNIDQLDCDHKGHLFALDNDNSCWHVLSGEGLNLQGSPFVLEHPATDIAVIDNSDIVFLSDQIGQSVQCWHGTIQALQADYHHATDFNAVDIGFGKVAVDRADHVYVAHSRRGVITIFDKYGKPLQYLNGGSPPLNAPTEIGVTGTGQTIYVLESVGIGPSQITKWVKRK